LRTGCDLISFPAIEEYTDGNLKSAPLVHERINTVVDALKDPAQTTPLGHISKEFVV